MNIFLVNKSYDVFVESLTAVLATLEEDQKGKFNREERETENILDPSKKKQDVTGSNETLNSQFGLGQKSNNGENLSRCRFSTFQTLRQSKPQSVQILALFYSNMELRTKHFVLSSKKKSSEWKQKHFPMLK